MFGRVVARWLRQPLLAVGARATRPTVRRLPSLVPIPAIQPWKTLLPLQYTHSHSSSRVAAVFFRLPSCASQQRGVKTVKRQTKRGYRKPSKYKMKRSKAFAARFRITGNGKVKYWHSGRVHNSFGKSRKRHRLLRRPAYATGKKRTMVIRALQGYN